MTALAAFLTFSWLWLTAPAPQGEDMPTPQVNEPAAPPADVSSDTEPLPKPLATPTPVKATVSETVFSAGLEACLDRPIRQHTLLGCGTRGCQARRPLENLLTLVPLGQPATRTTLERLALRIQNSQLTQRYELRCAPLGTEAELILEVEPMRFIRRVKITGNDAFRRKDILKRVFLRAGTPLILDPQAPEQDPSVQRQLESIIRFYRQEGVDDTEIKVKVHSVSSQLFDLEFEIKEGMRTRIDELIAHHEHRGASDSQATIGCPRIEERQLFRLLQIDVGDVWTRLVERQLQERLRMAFQGMGFERPRIAITPPSGSRGRLSVTVETERCHVIRLWQRNLAQLASDDELSFRWQDPIHHQGPRGNANPFKRLSLEEWIPYLPFGESGAFEHEEATRGVLSLGSELRARGYPFADIQMFHRELDRSTSELPQNSTPASPDVLNVIDYFITLNLERRLNKVRFEGLKTFDEEQIVDIMKTRAYDFLGASGSFDEGRVQADLNTIETFYRERGFYAFRFRAPEALSERHVLYPYGSDTRVFALEKLPSSPHLSLVIAFDEGPRTELGEVQLSGFQILSHEEVSKLTGFERGKAFGLAPLRQGMERLSRHYRRRGYHRHRFTPTCRYEGLEIPCDDRGLSVPGEVDFELHISEGPQARIQAIIWRGNAETDPHVLTRDLPKVGDVYDFDKVNTAVRKMRQLGIFNSVRVDAEGLDDRPSSDTNQTTETSEVVLVVSVEEAQPRFLDVALGLRSIQRNNLGRVPSWAASGAGLLVGQGDRLSTGFGRVFGLSLPDMLLTFDFEYLDLNSQGIGNQLRIPFVAGFSLSKFLRLASFNPSYTFPRVFDTDLKLVLRTIAEFDQVSDPLDRLELGLESELLVPLSQQLLLSLTTRAGLIQLNQPDADCVYCLSGPAIGLGTTLPQDGTEFGRDSLACQEDPDSEACRNGNFRPQFSISLRARYDTQDTPLHPTRGFLLSGSTSFILDRDRLSSSPVFNQFVKWEASLRGSISLADFVFAGFIRYGGAATFGEDFLPADERFTLGGSNGLRGFTDNGVCRYDRDGNLDAGCPGEFGGNVIVQGSFELRAPLLTNIGVWLGAFMDFGALAQDHDSLYPESFRFSTGLGLRWLLGGLFPIRLDLGFPLFERRCTGYNSEGECLKEDASQVHFGLLYTF